MQPLASDWHTDDVPAKQKTATCLHVRSDGCVVDDEAPPGAAAGACRATPEWLPPEVASEHQPPLHVR